MGRTKYSTLDVSRPDLAEEWNWKKNVGISPSEVTPGIRKKVWWKCKKGHEYEASLNNRSRGRNCPYCDGKKVCQDNCLEIVRPDVAKQWHPTKNGKLKPSDVSYGSNRSVWFICEYGHSFEMKICNKCIYGCPYCSNQRIDLDNCLATTHPDIAKQWHPTKNGELLPTQIPAGSSKQVWFQCDKADDHVWATSLCNRQHNGCPFCKGKKLSKTNSLATLFPAIAVQWHPNKNGTLTPDAVLAGSHKRVWWQCCKNGHCTEWRATIGDRTQKRSIKRFEKGCAGGCPTCLHEWKSNAMLERFRDGFHPVNHHYYGWYTSPIAGDVFYRSSFEARAFQILDMDTRVVTYKTEPVRIPYRKPGKKLSSYLPDLLVTYKDDTNVLVELKPKWALRTGLVKRKIKAGKKYASQQNLKFEVWTEDHLYSSLAEMTKFCRNLRSKQKGDHR